MKATAKTKDPGQVAAYATNRALRAEMKERQLVRLLELHAEGLSDADIGASLGIGAKTASRLRSNLGLQPNRTARIWL